MKKLFLLLLPMIMVSCGGGKQSEQTDEALSVRVEKAVLGNDYALTPYVGVVEEESSTMVSFTGMAMLKQMTVSEGQHVRKGQLLATIDDTQARNALTAAKAALDQALDAQTRMKQLHESGSLPDMKWVEVESQVRQAQASYEMCKKNLAECSIYAPVSGVVGSKVLGVGETTLPTEPVLTILSINNVKIRVSIPEREIASITPSTPTQITVDALPGETFVGGRIEKGVMADAMAHTYDIRILVPNPGFRLLPGMVARVMMNASAHATESKVTVPVKAVQQSSDKRLFVWIVKDGKAHRQTVTVGEVVGNRIIVESGISENTEVVVDGYQKLGEGSPVTCNS